MELPLFPLHLVLFPGRPLPLHIFEPRYRQMLGDCLAADRRFGVIAIRAGREVGGDVDIFEVGTVAQIESVSKLPDGRADIVTRGRKRFRVQCLLPGTPYLRARIELLNDPPVTLRDRRRAQQLRALLVPYLAGLGAPQELLERLPADPNGLAYLAAAVAQVDVPEQQRLLECDSTEHRLEATLGMLRRETGLMRHFGTVASLRPPGPGGAELN
ncbi:MAG: LON peptidase substrate-binding domain-containing protein [Actinomycetota bacterium]|nr:LON peptidase substrate-binding domain-containing protein [Actinomycetota bacterium]